VIYKPASCLLFAAIWHKASILLQASVSTRDVALFGGDAGTHLSSARSRAGEWIAVEGCCPDSGRSPWSSWEWACLSPTGPQSGALSLWGRQKSNHIKDHSLRNIIPHWTQNPAPTLSRSITKPLWDSHLSYLHVGSEKPVMTRVTCANLGESEGATI